MMNIFMGKDNDCTIKKEKPIRADTVYRKLVKKTAVSSLNEAPPLPFNTKLCKQMISELMTI